jgi:Arginase family
MTFLTNSLQEELMIWQYPERLAGTDAAASERAPLRKFRVIGAKAALAHIADGERVYVSIDIDSFDPSIALGTATISHGGFTYYEVARRFEVVGVDFMRRHHGHEIAVGITGRLDRHVVHHLGHRVVVLLQERSFIGGSCCRRLRGRVSPVRNQM